MHQEIAEIRCVHGFQAVLILPVKLGCFAVGELRAWSASDLIRRQAAILPALHDDRERTCRPTLLVNVSRPQDLFQQAHLIVAVENRKIGPEADKFGVTPQDSRRHGVECAEPQPLRRPADEARDALHHLSRRFVGERDGQDFARKCSALMQDMREAGG